MAKKYGDKSHRNPPANFSRQALGGPVPLGDQLHFGRGEGGRGLTASLSRCFDRLPSSRQRCVSPASNGDRSPTLRQRRCLAIGPLARAHLARTRHLRKLPLRLVPTSRFEDAGGLILGARTVRSILPIARHAV